MILEIYSVITKQKEGNLIFVNLTAAQMGWKGWAHFNQPSKTAPRISKWIPPLNWARQDL